MKVHTIRQMPCCKQDKKSMRTARLLRTVYLQEKYTEKQKESLKQQKEEETLWIGRDQEFKLVIVYKEDNYKVKKVIKSLFSWFLIYLMLLKLCNQDG